MKIPPHFYFPFLRGLQVLNKKGVGCCKVYGNIDYKGFNMTHFGEKLLENSHFDYMPSYGVIRRIFTEPISK